MAHMCRGALCCHHTTVARATFSICPSLIVVSAKVCRFGPRCPWQYVCFSSKLKWSRSDPTIRLRTSTLKELHFVNGVNTHNETRFTATLDGNGSLSTQWWFECTQASRSNWYFVAYIVIWCFRTILHCVVNVPVLSHLHCSWPILSAV